MFYLHANTQNYILAIWSDQIEYSRIVALIGREGRGVGDQTSVNRTGVGDQTSLIHESPQLYCAWSHIIPPI